MNINLLAYFPSLKTLLITKLINFLFSPSSIRHCIEQAGIRCCLDDSWNKLHVDQFTSSFVSISEEDIINAAAMAAAATSTNKERHIVHVRDIFGGRYLLNCLYPKPLLDP